MYNVCSIGHKQAVLISIKFKLTHEEAECPPVLQYVKISFMKSATKFTLKDTSHETRIEVKC